MIETMTSSAVVCFPSPNNDTDLSFPIRRKIRSCRETNDSCSGAENIQDEPGYLTMSENKEVLQNKIK